MITETARFGSGHRPWLFYDHASTDRVQCQRKEFAQHSQDVFQHTASRLFSLREQSTHANANMYTQLYTYAHAYTRTDTHTRAHKIHAYAYTRAHSD